MRHGLKFVLLYWLNSPEYTEVVKTGLQRLEEVKEVEDLVVGTPSDIVDDVIVADYDVAAVISFREESDFPVIFQSEQHLSIGKYIHDHQLAKNMQGFMIRY
ncbi:MAG: hypothetical protein IJ108_03985 [Eubacterium sp.]|nr:hypothetical protein [Eubacterium sp.]